LQVDLLAALDLPRLKLIRSPIGPASGQNRAEGEVTIRVLLYGLGMKRNFAS